MGILLIGMMPLVPSFLLVLATLLQSEHLPNEPKRTATTVVLASENGRNLAALMRTSTIILMTTIWYVVLS